MEYTIKQMADLAGISTSTLRYYDKINLLKPKAVSKAGYRIYGEREVDALQQVLFYKNLGVELTEIKTCINAPGFNKTAMLTEQLTELNLQKQELELLVNNVEKTIQREKGLVQMTDTEKFEGLRREL